MNLSVSLGLTFSIFAIILIVTSGGLLQSSFGSSIEESVDEIVESAEEDEGDQGGGNGDSDNGPVD